jgi:hypothetical protein
MRGVFWILGITAMLPSPCPPSPNSVPTSRAWHPLTRARCVSILRSQLIRVAIYGNLRPRKTIR